MVFMKIRSSVGEESPVSETAQAILEFRVLISNNVFTYFMLKGGVVINITEAMYFIRTITKSLNELNLLPEGSLITREENIAQDFLNNDDEDMDSLSMIVFCDVSPPSS